jgi:hypothetical protein
MSAWKGIVGQGFTAREFNRYLATVTFSIWRPQLVVVHNTFIPSLAEWHSVPGPRRMEGFQSYYRDQMKWSAGPHLFVADDLIWVFTPLNTSGIHSPSWNGISWGVELVGDYSKEAFTAPVRKNAVTALAALHQLAGLDPQTLRLHREDPQTTHKNCPGPHVVKADLVQAISGTIAAEQSGEHTPGAAAGGATI